MAEEKNAVTVESSRTVKLHDKNGNLHCEFEATHPSRWRSWKRPSPR
jgi:hypothetical protein